MDPKHPPLLRIIEEELIDYRIRSRFSHPDFVKKLGLSGSERVLEFGSGGGCRAPGDPHRLHEVAAIEMDL